jgi:hypothetical protein
MDMCNNQNIVIHDFAEIVERLPSLTLHLDRKVLGEFLEVGEEMKQF